MSGSKSLFLPFLVFFLVVATSITAAADTPEKLAKQAVSENSEESAAAIRALRELGYEGLDALMSLNRTLISEHLNGTADASKWERAARAIDSVAKQKDAWASGLYWHTDLKAAIAESSKTGKPVISLRLLGNLDEDLSCANSRFFRTLLYSDQRISKLMRSSFVLHWKSQRPAPKITVEFGDGRKLVTTVTGNSIHYFLRQDGAVIDALPGLYAPDAFLGYLYVLSAAGNEEQNARAHRVRTWSYLVRKWRSDLEELGAEPPEIAPRLAETVLSADAASASTPPSAIEAAPMAVTKMVAEAVLLQPSAAETETLLAVTKNELWNALAERYGQTGLSPEAMSIVRKKADPQRKLTEEEFLSMLRRLDTSLALDAVRNEYILHLKILEWLESGSVSGLEDLNRRVYSEMFLTPDSDPWLGLDPLKVFNAVDGSGIRQ